MATLSLTLIEIIVLMLGAITLGITIHFFIVSRKSLKTTALNASGKVGKDLEQWKLKYFNDIEIRDKELSIVRQQLAETEENNDINSIEADEMRKLNKKLQTELELVRKTAKDNNNDSNALEADELRKLNIKLQAELESVRKASKQERNDTAALEADELRKLNIKLQAELESVRKASAAGSVTTGKKPDYMEQLRQAQSGLMEHNEKINLLLGQIDLVKETEEKKLEIERINKELTIQINDLKYLLSQKEEEINNTRQKESLTTEMTSRLDSAYNEFNVLQDKIQKLEAQLISSKRISLDYEDLKETNSKITRDFDDQKSKNTALSSENQRLQSQLAEAENHFREANFQRQQLQKRVAYLEELNNDMQAVAEANKKLESQLKRVGELESRLNMVAEERDELVRKQFKGS